MEMFSTKKFTTEEYENDKKNIIAKYNEHGYRDAVLLSDSVANFNEKKVDIFLKVDEGEKYYLKDIRFVGNTQYSTDYLMAVLGMKPGEVYNQKKLNERLSTDEDAVSNVYFNNGYLFFNADPVEVDVANDSISLEIRIQEGPQATINRIIINGNDRLYEDIVRRELRTKPGMLFSRDDLMRSVRELAQMGHFDPENMIKVEQQADGSYSFADDGRHRIAAAQELGYEIPVQVTNLPENANASAADVKPEGTATAEDVANKSDISSETRENLGAFEQNNWDNLSQVEKEQAVENLRDSIAKDLQLENKPNIAYYNHENPGDYGGYAASNNTIYINRFNMGDAAETADTIAHESRHCWQHERADNPQTEQDYQFKENFDDYVCPEDDYRGYRDQPVEADARDYAQNITDNILTGHPNATSEISPENTNSNATESEIRQREEGKGAVFDESSEIPTDIDKKVDDFESKVREPEQYDSKYDYDNQKKLEDYYKQGDGKLTDEQKSALTDELKTNYDATSKEDRGDVRVPENEKDVSCVYYDGNTKKYDIGYNWKDGTVPESREMKVMQVGDQFDRVGPPSGKCVGEVNSDGTCATREQRSIPYHLNEANITDEPSYHRYEAEQDFTKENLDNAIDNSSFYTDAQKAEMHQKVDDYYDRSHAKYGDGDGLAYGEIAPMFEDTTGSTGGGYQYDMPLSMDELENIGMISEVPRGSY